MYLTIGIILSLFSVQIFTEKCITPNNEKSECVSFCSVLIGALATQQEGPNEFVRHSNCAGTGTNPVVGCGTSGNIIKEKNYSNNDNSRNSTQKINLLPTRRYCGYQQSDDYFRAPNATPTLTEFPWLAMVTFKPPDSDSSGSICGGSLINNRYVLTAAHCLYSFYEKPEAVHLGEYHIRNKTDCVTEPPFDQKCSDPVAIFGIEKAIPHPKWSRINKTNDIALLRLNRTVSYSDYIRPICLPLPGTTFAKVGETLISSGWGYRKMGDSSYVETKKKSLSTLIENEPCALAYINDRSKVTKNQLCTIPALGTSIDFECQGDSGGPLLFSYRNQWHQEGIISFGKSCATRIPNVYTKVANYLDWILESIEI